LINKFYGRLAMSFFFDNVIHQLFIKHILLCSIGQSKYLEGRDFGG